MGALSRVARELGIPRVRKPMENLRDSWESSRGERPAMLPELFAAAAARMVTPIFQSTARRYDLQSPDYFLGLARTGRLRPEALRRMIGTVQEGSTEIMLHPGISQTPNFKQSKRASPGNEIRKWTRSSTPPSRVPSKNMAFA